MIRRLIQSLFILLLIVGCVFAQSAFDKYLQTPININTLERKDGVHYTKDTNELYT